MPDPALEIHSPDRVLRASRQYRRPLGEILVDMGVIGPRQLMQALALHGQCQAPLSRICLAEGLATEEQLQEALALRHGIRRLGPRDASADPSLAALLPPEVCREHDLLPWSQAGGCLTLATCSPESAEGALAALPQLAGRQVSLVLVPERLLHREMMRLHGPAFATAAETAVPEPESCRDFLRASPARTRITAAACCVMATAIFIAPQMVFTLLSLWAVTAMALSALLKIACLISLQRDRPEPEPPRGGPPDGPGWGATDSPPDDPGGASPPFARPGAPPAAPGTAPTAPAAWQARQMGPQRQEAPLPVISLLVPLFHESDIAGHLVARLARLGYPRALLDIVLVLEDCDERTRQTLERTRLPPWFRIVEVPAGTLRTKPRAMNHALGFCRGEIVGIYDAEDAPDPDQLLRIAHAFQRGPPDLACLQGVLDYYNPHQSWIARCFTIEYATWFRLVLPGLARLGLAVPLGGTTLFLRRDILEKLHGWDAHNVTEDADLGIRLARHGYRTDLIASVTQEEANDRPWRWIRQRSRWLKGYMVTYLVHMRHPRVLWRQFGPRRFAGFQVFFLCALSQFLLAPLLWSFWLVPFGLPHPLATLLAPSGLMAVGALLLAGAAADLCAALLAVRATRHQRLGRWVPSIIFYFPLATLAAYKALWELILQPFYWDKTEHGHAPLQQEVPNGAAPDRAPPPG